MQGSARACRTADTRLAPHQLPVDACSPALLLDFPRCSAKKEFVKCGILRQLLGVLGGNTGKQYAVILKKVGARRCRKVWGVGACLHCMAHLACGSNGSCPALYRTKHLRLGLVPIRYFLLKFRYLPTHADAACGGVAAADQRRHAPHAVGARLVCRPAARPGPVHRL